MTSWTHRTIIVPAAFQQLAQGLCAAAAEGDAGAGMFTTGLSATGALPATHYISSGFMSTEFGDLLPLTTFDEEGAPTTRPGDLDVITTQPGNVAVVETMAAQAGITLPAGTIAALFSAIDVSEQGPFDAMARCGLKLVQEAP